MTADLDAFPPSVRPPTGAGDGPVVDGAPLREGDVLAGPDGPRVVAGTGHGPANAGVALFDPEARRRRVLDGDAPVLSSGVARRALGVARTVADDRVTLYYASYDPRTGRFRCECGRAPLGATVVPFEASTTAGTLADLRAAIDPPLAADSPLSGPTAGTASTDALATLAETVGSADLSTGNQGVDPPGGTPASAPALSASDVAIPTGEADILAGSGPPVQPGDRLIYWPDRRPPADVLAADVATLAAGRCEVVLDRTTLYDLAGGGRESVDAGEFRRLFDRTRDRGVVLRLLARECHVDPIGRAHTDSVHVYEAEADGDRTALACGDRQATATPRLEHPLALSVETAPDLGPLLDRLRGGGGPLAPWIDEEATAALCARVADRARETAVRRPDCEGFDG